MKIAVITHVTHIKENDFFYAYGPYVKEMNIWFKYVDKVVIVAPITEKLRTPIDLKYNHNIISFYKVPSFSLISVSEIIKTIIRLPQLICNVFLAMKKADHIHLRCPGNMGLLGCLVQMLFPHKKKTAKYAGNWDPKSKQPLTYRIQKWILNNTFLTKNMTVLVYGEWEGSSKNIKPFFTASYKESEKEEVLTKTMHDPIIEFLFVGTLSLGKQPLYAIKLVQQLALNHKNIRLKLYGDGVLKNEIENYIQLNSLQNIVNVLGNQDSEVIKKAYQKSHFLILPSKSEGWPKVVAEAMFWGCLPIVTNVSCVSGMLNNNERGVMLTMELAKDIKNVMELILYSNDEYDKRVINAMSWSRRYTVDFFDKEIYKLI